MFKSVNYIWKFVKKSVIFCCKEIIIFYYKGIIVRDYENYARLILVYASWLPSSRTNRVIKSLRGIHVQTCVTMYKIQEPGNNIKQRC